MWFPSAQSIRRHGRWICRAHSRFGYGACEVAQGKVRSNFVLSKEFTVSQFEGTVDCPFRAHSRFERTVEQFECTVDGFFDRAVDSKALSSTSKVPPMAFSSAESSRRHCRAIRRHCRWLFRHCRWLLRAHNRTEGTVEQFEGTVDGFFERTVDSKALSSDFCNFRLFQLFRLFWLFRPFGFSPFRLKLLPESNI